MREREVTTDDGLLKFLISDSLEEYRVRTLLTKEPETINWIDNWLPVNSAASLRFWDVGSNIGMYTLYAAAKHSNLQVVSFEPFFKNFIRLKANIRLNELDNITPLYIALSKKSGLVKFCVEDERFGASGNVVMSPEEFEKRSAQGKGDAHYKAQEIMLQASGDDLLKMNLEPPNYLKIDVDGLELSIVEGMADILGSSALKSVLVEINGKEDLKAIKIMFANHGLVPDDRFNLVENHSRKRRSIDSNNTAENWVFTKL